MTALGPGDSTRYLGFGLLRVWAADVMLQASKDLELGVQGNVSGLQAKV